MLFESGGFHLATDIGWYSGVDDLCGQEKLREAHSVKLMPLRLLKAITQHLKSNHNKYLHRIQKDTALVNLRVYKYTHTHTLTTGETDGKYSHRCVHVRKKFNLM